MNILVIIIAVLIAVFFIYMAVTYYKLAGFRKKVNEQWSQIDIELKKRFDLIPNLVNTVKEHVKSDSKVVDGVVKARITYLTSGTVENAMNANNELSLALSSLYSEAEAIPGLMTNEDFIKTKSELEETENKIDYACKFYNDSVMMLNSAIEKFPSSIIAKMYRFKPMEFFKTHETE